MALSDGMVAIVRSIQEAAGGLCVTLLDGNRQYTLLPNSAVPQQANPGNLSAVPQHANSRNPYTPLLSAPTQKADVTYNVEADRPCDSSCQAVDGRYASVYKMSHCNVEPTSPPSMLTEFPPQRQELSPGLGNFVVGGNGSGEASFSPVRNSTNYRGGMCWPDRGSVCSPRPSREPDAFARSLRKYPSMSPERSAEIVERLINCSNLRNNRPSKLQSSEYPTQNYDRSPQYEPTHQRSRRAEMNLMATDMSPTRERCNGVGDKNAYSKPYDVRYNTNMNKKGASGFSAYPYNHPVCPPIQERYEHLPPAVTKLSEPKARDSVNMETQATVSTVSREITTTPRVQPSTRNVAIPLSPVSSSTQSSRQKHIIHYSKSVQTKDLDMTLKRKSIQTCFSSVDLLDSKTIRHDRKSKSQQDLKKDDNFDEETVQYIQDLTKPTEFNKHSCQNKLLKSLRKLHKVNKNEKLKLKIGSTSKDIYSEQDLKQFTKELSNDLLSKLKQQNVLIQSASICRADMQALRKSHDNTSIDDIVNEWLSDIPIKSTDYLNREVKKEQILKAIGKRVRNLMIDKVKYSSDRSINAEIMCVLEDMPIDVKGNSKGLFLNKLVADLMKKVKSVTVKDSRRRWIKPPVYCNYIQPTEDEMKQFITNEIKDLKNNSRFEIYRDEFTQIINELAALLLDSIEIIRQGKTRDIVSEMHAVLAEFLNISDLQAMTVANNIINNLKEVIRQSTNPPQTLMVIKKDFSDKHAEVNTGIPEENNDVHPDIFLKQIIEQVNEWLFNIKGIDKIDPNLRLMIVNDLAADIVDRHKYLKINPPGPNVNLEELEHLKYQIFKWINKVAGDDNMDTILRADELMERIKSITLSMQGHEVKTDEASLIACSKRSTLVLRQETDSNTNKRRFSSPDSSQPPSPAVNNQRRQSSPPNISPFFKNGTASVQENPNTTDTTGGQNARRFSSPDGILPSGSTANKQCRQSCPGSIPPCCKNKKKTINGNFRENSCKEPYEPNNGADLPSTSATVPTTAHNESIKQLNEEYDEYVKNWVKQIPIATSNPEEQELAEKARLGLYVGVWKAITKLKMCPDALDNSYLYQDALDDEIEEMLQCLPQTPEFKSKKQTLKSQLIEKTNEINKRFANTAGASTYKQQLVDNLTNKTPKTDVNYAGKDINRLYEEWEKMFLAELFIMFTNYRNSDKVKANAYKKKLMNHVEKMLENIKVTHGTQLKDIDNATYKHEVMAALEDVPLPSDETIKHEANEIMIGLEIEQWFNDLPLLPNEEEVVKLGKRVYQEMLARKLYDIEEHCDPNIRDDQMKLEIRRFIERMPLRPEEKQNMDFMVEELLNRLNNRANDIIAASGKRKSVTIMDGYEYDDFSRDIPHCSSFDNNRPRAQIDGSSYIIADGTRVSKEQGMQRLQSPFEGLQLWHTLQESARPAPWNEQANVPGSQNNETHPPDENIGSRNWSHESPEAWNVSPPGQTTQDPVNNGGVGVSQNSFPLTSNQRSYGEDRARHIYQPYNPNLLYPPPIDTSEYIPRQDTGRPYVSSSMQKPHYGYFDMSRPQAHSTPRSQDPSRPVDYGTSGMQRPQYDSPDSRPQMPSSRRHIYNNCGIERQGPAVMSRLDRTIDQGTNPVPKTTDTGTEAPGVDCKARFSAPPCNKTDRSNIPIKQPRGVDPEQVSGAPMGYSTPHDAQRPWREAERGRRENRRLVEETEFESEEERCRCMERVWRCRRRLRPCSEREYVPCQGGRDYPPCFMRVRPRECFY